MKYLKIPAMALLLALSLAACSGTGGQQRNMGATGQHSADWNPITGDSKTVYMH